MAVSAALHAFGLVAPDFVYWGTLLSAVETLKGGTTTFADWYYFRDEMARAAVDAGIRLVRDREILTVDEDEVMERARGFGARVREVMAGVAGG